MDKSTIRGKTSEPRDCCFSRVADLPFARAANHTISSLSRNGFADSPNRWVFSERLPQQQRIGHQFYSVANNTGGKPLDGLSWKIAYGDGSGASGVVFADRVKVGGVTATRQAVEAATSISAQFIEEHSDGLLGLGFGNTNTIKPTKQPTFFENIKPSLKEPLFTVTLKKNATGVYDFGYIDPQKYIVCFFP